MREWRLALRERLGGLGLPPAREAEIIDELVQHLDDRREDLIAGGVPGDEAGRIVFDELIAEGGLLNRRLSGLRQAHAPLPIAPGTPPRRFFADIVQDLRYAGRALRRSPGFAAAAIVTLALGIGANTAIFSLVDAVLLRRLPVSDPERLVFVQNGLAPVFPYPNYADLRDRNDVFDGLIGWGGIGASLNVDGDTELVNGAIVTGNYFSVLGVGAELGRVIVPSDDVTPMGHPVVAISHGLWQRRFGGRADALGRTIVLNGHPFVIVGVIGPDFPDARPGVSSEIFVPMMMQPLMRPPRAGYSGEMNPDLLNNRRNGWVLVAGRLKPGVTLTAAETSLTGLRRQLVTANQTAPPPPDAPPIRVPVTPFLEGGNASMRRTMVTAAGLLTATVGAVLLIACANVANLLLARATVRRREIALRLAMGASRWRLVRQLMTESLLIGLFGGFGGVGVAWWMTGALVSSPPLSAFLPARLAGGPDARVLLYALGLSLVTTLVFGLVPALSASSPSLIPSLKDAPAAAASRPRRLGLKRGLVIAQVTLSIVLLVVAGLFARTLATLQASDPGFDVDRLVTTPLDVNLLRYTRAQGREFYRRTIDAVSAVPGIDSAALARVGVLTGGGRTVSVRLDTQASAGVRFMSEGAGGGGAATRADSVSANIVTPTFFETMGIPLLKGRTFSESDADGGPFVVVASQTMAQRLFGDADPIGRRVTFTDGERWLEIIGVVRDAKYSTLAEGPVAVAYLPLSQNHETGMVLYARTSGNPAAFAQAVRRTVQAIEPNLPLQRVVAMTTAVDPAFGATRTGTAVLVGFGALALALTVIGLYGVLSYATAERQRELSVRLALGATRGGLFALVLREGMTLVAIGTAVGLAGAAYGSRWLASFLVGTSPLDVATFVSVPVVLAAVALAACVLPARRAMRAEPMSVLR